MIINKESRDDKRGRNRRNEKIAAQYEEIFRHLDEIGKLSNEAQMLLCMHWFGCLPMFYKMFPAARDKEYIRKIRDQLNTRGFKTEVRARYYSNAFRHQLDAWLLDTSIDHGPSTHEERADPDSPYNRRESVIELIDFVRRFITRRRPHIAQYELDKWLPVPQQQWYPLGNDDYLLLDDNAKPVGVYHFRPGDQLVPRTPDLLKLTKTRQENDLQLQQLMKQLQDIAHDVS